MTFRIWSSWLNILASSQQTLFFFLPSFDFPFKKTGSEWAPILAMLAALLEHLQASEICSSSWYLKFHKPVVHFPWSGDCGMLPLALSSLLKLLQTPNSACYCSAEKTMMTNHSHPPSSVVFWSLGRHSWNDWGLCISV